ncbi:hypothetical protein ASPNIDRAFT_44014 [Aspergillus niger ATCC 1015]|uniref:Uncharacterized protein n=1 Tax=Aspergillus niger (strain ATCC 1015 / CBS 113.46 / FGSC A1144 / LSHB Ac4 / NCTC 3858a / NRRL 328 / USDA 3528.7) TaxID=380704 RepID=G3Y946_ASPNA|nr:hypothetical protein ASPNIDRAFT_44014 [Aspergillus niger ATCC 1015]
MVTVQAASVSKPAAIGIKPKSGSPSILIGEFPHPDDNPDPRHPVAACPQSQNRHQQSPTAPNGASAGGNVMACVARDSRPINISSKDMMLDHVLSTSGELSSRGAELSIIVDFNASSVNHST